VAGAYPHPGEGIGLAARVILHLAALRRLGPNDMAEVDRTQQGMVDALGARQGSLVRVLQRLLSGKVVTVERRFVLGPNRRMKVYHLSPLGESAAASLQRKSARTTPSADRSLRTTPVEDRSGPWMPAPRSDGSISG
jgi:DNA-binding PadR family transcriptional regulator